MGFESVDDVVPYVEYRRTLKVELGRLRATAKYVRYFKRFTYDDRKIRPLVLIGRRPDVEGLVKDLFQTEVGGRDGADDPAQAGKRPAPKDPGWALCHREPDRIVFQVVRGKIRAKDLQKLVALAGVTLPVVVQPIGAGG